MRFSNLFKRSCVAFSLLMLLACGGGGGGGDSAPPAPTTSPNILVTESEYDFGGVVLGNSADRTFEIKNTGNANLTIGDLSWPAVPFSISSDTCSRATVAPSQSCFVRARFSPVNTRPIGDTYTSAFYIPSNDPDSSAVSVTLRGVGYGLNVWINRITPGTCPSMSADVTVTTYLGGSLPNLLAGDFKLYENGSLAAISNVSAPQPSPVSLVLAIDWSYSTTSVITSIQTAAKTFLGLLAGTDEAAICKFNGWIELNDSQSNPLAPLFYPGTDAALASYIDKVFASVTGTALYDAVYQSIERAAVGNQSMKAVVVLSDGVNEALDPKFPQVHTLDEVIARAKERGIPVFTIYYIGEYGNTEIMQRLARETGGQYYNGNTASLDAIFQQIKNVLGSKYTITYTSSTCPSLVPVRVQAVSGDLYGWGNYTP